MGWEWIAQKPQNLLEPQIISSFFFLRYPKNSGPTWKSSLWADLAHGTGQAGLELRMLPAQLPELLMEELACDARPSWSLLYAVHTSEDPFPFFAKHSSLLLQLLL